MMQTEKFHGVFPPVPTIVNAQGALDKKGMATLLDHLIANQVNGVLLLGSGGEFCHMTKEQRLEAAEFCVQHINHRIPVLLGISSTCAQDVIHYGLHADRLEVDAVLVLNPYYARLTDDYIYHHFKTVAESIKTPVILYNFPALTGQDLSIDLITRLAHDIPNIIGIKDTVDNISHIREIINTVRPVRPDFVIFSGYDEYMMDTLIMGGNGGIPATANFAPQLTCGIYRAWCEKEYETLFRLQRRLSALSTIYSLDTPFFGIIKKAIQLSGIDIPVEVMPPVQPANEAHIASLKKVLQRAGL
ncbi:dihydrodipicolinate synthase family protein [Citrobacter farmeri]|uniref:dihydrodipicolinate synthase family protein n=1 Tax=Citrobacter farmeri TaxID=67824 RepID=UPI002A806214|nr:dihydrodipicolinate synthase family protein [Citrobacter farmeri]